MTAKYIALLRGINVGRAKRIAMSDLRTIIEGLGYGEVRTLLNSGNVVFTATGTRTDHVAARIEREIEAKLGVSARVTILTGAELKTAIAGNTLLESATDHSRLLLAVLRDGTDLAKLKPLMKQAWGKERLALGSRVAYIWCPVGIIDSQLSAAVGKALGDGVTSRTWATVLKLHALVDATKELDANKRTKKTKQH